MTGITAGRRRSGPARGLRLDCRRLLATLLAGALAVIVPARAQDLDARQLAEVKAGFVLNFIRYTTWPEESFDGPDAPLRVVVLGDAAVAETLQAIASRAGAVSSGRRVTVDRILFSSVDELLSAHVVYIGDSSDHATMELLERLAGHDVLVVGDGREFAAAGGMIGIWRDGERLVFDANPEAIRATRIVVSARVLKLARLVETGGAA